MKHAMYVVSLLLLFTIFLTDSSDNSKAIFVYPERKKIDWTDDERLAMAIVNNNMPYVKLLMRSNPELLHKRSSFGYPIHLAKNVTVAQFLINWGALDNHIITHTLLHAAMAHSSTHPDVVALYLKKGVCSLSIDGNNFTPLMDLALMSGEYKNKEQCVQKARFFIDTIRPEQRAALCAIKDHINHRNVFDCIEQSRKSGQYPESSVALKAFLEEAVGQQRPTVHDSNRKVLSFTQQD